MLRQRMVVLHAGLCALLTLSLVACNEERFEGSTPTKSRKPATQDLNADGRENPFDTTTPSKLNEMGPTTTVPASTLCSNRLSEANGTNLRLADTGASIKLYRRNSEVADSSATLVIDDASIGQQIRKDIMASRNFKFTPPKTLQDGTYDLLICDRKFGDQCARAPGQDFQRQSVRGGASLLTRPFGKGTLGYAPAVEVINGQVKLKTPVVVLVNHNPGDLKSQAAFSQGFAQIFSAAANNQQPDISAMAGFYGAADAPDAGECDAKASPLVVDLSGQGVQLSSPEEGVLFDIRGNGELERISWLSHPQQYLLVRDDVENNSRGEAEIRSVHELFGNNTRGPDGQKAANGFAALQKFDFNGDQRINRLDAVFGELRLWHDANQDGIGQERELLSLEQAGLASLDLNFSSSDAQDRYGNQFSQIGRVEASSGQIFEMIDVWFRSL